ncbi:hypothetical protein H0H93_009298, partial [Arthromyces matolae]
MSNYDSDLVIEGPRKRNASERTVNNPDFEAATRKRSRTTIASASNQSTNTSDRGRRRAQSFSTSPPPQPPLGFER